MAEVKKAPITVIPGRTEGQPESWFSPRIPTDREPAVNHTSGRVESDDVNFALAARRVRETIARSDTPVSDFQGYGRNVGVRVEPVDEFSSRVEGSWGRQPYGGDIVLHPRAPSADAGGSWEQEQRSKRVRQERVLMHELGHHRSQRVDENTEFGPVLRRARRGAPGTLDGSDYDPVDAKAAAVEIGREEGRADRNVDERYRPRRGDEAENSRYSGAAPASSYERGPSGFNRYLPGSQSRRDAAFAGYAEERGIDGPWTQDRSEDAKFEQWKANGRWIQPPLFWDVASDTSTSGRKYLNRETGKGL